MKRKQKQAMVDKQLNKPYPTNKVKAKKHHTKKCFYPMQLVNYRQRKHIESKNIMFIPKQDEVSFH